MKKNKKVISCLLIFAIVLFPAILNVSASGGDSLSGTIEIPTIGTNADNVVQITNVYKEEPESRNSFQTYYVTAPAKIIINKDLVRGVLEDESYMVSNIDYSSSCYSLMSDPGSVIMKYSKNGDYLGVIQPTNGEVVKGETVSIETIRSNKNFIWEIAVTGTGTGYLEIIKAGSIYILDEDCIYKIRQNIQGEPVNIDIVVTLPVQKPLTAIPTPSKVYLNGEHIDFDAYNINGNNYFKLRDLAFVLSGTEKQFEIDWDGVNNAISLTSGKPYTPVGGEMTLKEIKENKIPKPTTSKIYLDGEEVNFTVYNIDGNNYFKLRDVMQTFDVYVGYDDKTKTITLDTSNTYTEEEKNFDEIKSFTTTSNVDWIYYRGICPNEGLYKMRTDGTEKTKLDDEKGLDIINVVGDWIYYTSEYCKLNKIKTNGKEKTLLSSDVWSSINIVGDWIYYIGRDDNYNNNIYKMRTNGTGKVKLDIGGHYVEAIFVGQIYSTYTADSLKVVDNWIYYSNSYGIHKIKTDGTGNTKLITGEYLDYRNINVVNNWIYYLDYSSIPNPSGGSSFPDKIMLYKIKTNGKEKTKLSDDSMFSVNIVGDWIYYINESNFNLCKMRTDGTEKTVFINEVVDYFNIIGDYILYHSSIDTSPGTPNSIDNSYKYKNYYYKIRIDGTDKQLIETWSSSGPVWS
ncbi:MAG: DUF5050 domain-containing protein [Oscillospiraceae bacterium]|nr:DUF5050 domain-containing protein [Oscillospiraceae bacterium]